MEWGQPRFPSPHRITCTAPPHLLSVSSPSLLLLLISQLALWHASALFRVGRALRLIGGVLI